MYYVFSTDVIAQEMKLCYSCHPVYSPWDQITLGNPSSVKREYVVDLAEKKNKTKQTLVIVHGDDLCFILRVHRTNSVRRKISTCLHYLRKHACPELCKDC